MPDKLESLRQQEKILRELGKKQELAFTLGSQADLLLSQHDSEQALKRLEEAETLLREVGHDFGVEKALAGQVNILRSSEDHRRTLAVLQRQEAFYRQTGETDELAECLFNQTVAVHHLKDLKREADLCEMQIPLWRALDNKEKVAFCCGSAAMCLMQLHTELEKALDLAEQSVSAAREARDPGTISRALNTKALVLSAVDRHRDALKACVESAQTAKTHGVKQWVDLNQPLLAHLLRLQLTAIVGPVFKGEVKAAKEMARELEDGSALCTDPAVRSSVEKVITALRGATVSGKAETVSKADKPWWRPW